MYRRVARLRHRRCGNDQPDDDSSSSSAGAGSENAECIDLMSSSSPTSLRSSSSSSSHLAVKKTNHSSSSSSSSSSSDNESDEDEFQPGAWRVRPLKNEEGIEDLSSSSSSNNGDPDSDSDDDSDNNKEENHQSGVLISRLIQSHSRFVCNDEKEKAPQEQTSSHDLNRPLSPWKISSSKARIIEDLKNDQSSIHALASGWETNLDELWKKYAPQYPRSKFKGYMKTMMRNFSAKKGVFRDGCNINNHPTSDQCSSSWDKSNSRKRIIEDLMDYRSSIHRLVKDWEKKENLDELWQEYAPGYQRSKFKGYMGTIMSNFRAKKGEFKERWYATNNGNPSKEYSLLLALMVHGDIDGMTVAEVHASHALFAKYPLNEFKRYYRNMTGIADKRKARLKSHSQTMEEHFENWSRAGAMTSQGNYFWDEQDACTFLERDVKSGKVNEMSKEQLWESRPAYKKFKKRVFRKHVYQEQSKQRGGTYWQVKRNRKGQKKHDKEVRMLRSEFRGNVDDDVNKLVEKWSSMKNMIDHQK